MKLTLASNYLLSTAGPRRTDGNRSRSINDFFNAWLKQVHCVLRIRMLVVLDGRPISEFDFLPFMPVGCLACVWKTVRGMSGVGRGTRTWSPGIARRAFLNFAMLGKSAKFCPCFVFGAIILLDKRAAAAAEKWYMFIPVLLWSCFVRPTREIRRNKSTKPVLFSAARGSWSKTKFPNMPFLRFRPL